MITVVPFFTLAAIAVIIWVTTLTFQSPRVGTSSTKEQVNISNKLNKQPSKIILFNIENMSKETIHRWLPAIIHYCKLICPWPIWISSNNSEIQHALSALIEQQLIHFNEPLATDTTIIEWDNAQPTLQWTSTLHQGHMLSSKWFTLWGNLQNHTESMSGRQKDVSILITTYKRPRYLLKRLNALYHQNYTGTMEIWITGEQCPIWAKLQHHVEIQNYIQIMQDKGHSVYCCNTPHAQIYNQVMATGLITLWIPEHTQISENHVTLYTQTLLSTQSEWIILDTQLTALENWAIMTKQVKTCPLDISQLQILPTYISAPSTIINLNWEQLPLECNETNSYKFPLSEHILYSDIDVLNLEEYTILETQKLPKLMISSSMSPWQRLSHILKSCPELDFLIFNYNTSYLPYTLIHTEIRQEMIQLIPELWTQTQFEKYSTFFNNDSLYHQLEHKGAYVPCI